MLLNLTSQNHFLTNKGRSCLHKVRSQDHGLRLQPLLCTASWIVKPRLLSPPMTKQHSIPSSVSHQLTRPQLHILTVYRRHHHHQILLSSSRTEMGLGHLKDAAKDTGKRYKQQTLRTSLVTRREEKQCLPMSRISLRQHDVKARPGVVCEDVLSVYPRHSGLPTSRLAADTRSREQR